MNKKLTLRLLGNVMIEVDGRPLNGLPSRAAEALLIYLVCQDRPISRETLADLLWGERSQKQGLANLRTILTALRREVADYLIITRQTLAFNHAADYWLDTAVFENELAQLPAVTPLPPKMVQRLQAADSLYQGDFLASFSLREGPEFEAWALLRREQLRRLAALGLRGLAAHHLAVGDYQPGLAYVEKLLTLDPYDEAAHRQLMWLLVRCGQPNIALQRHQKFSQLLALELGIEPAPETGRLYQRIKAARTFSSNNLPHQSSPFVGRKTELQQISASLANPTCRLLTLVGPGGIGKTRLAIEAARQQQHILLDGVCFTSLAGLSSDDFLVLAIAGALHLSLQSVADPRAQLLNALREREILLLLDNFEHLLVSPEGGQGLRLLIDILSAAPEVKIVVTSRERLNLEEEWLFQVDGLPAPDPQVDHDIAGNSAVQLFVQNASRVQSGFAPTEAALADIGQICRLVEGMPLAIKLAAAWVQALSCRQIALEIEDSLAFLQSSAQNALPRQRSIQTVFEHSWQLLLPEEQQILCQLSVFRGGFNFEAAQHVAGAILEALGKLVNKSWLTLNVEGRYEWHELLRRYAAEKLDQSGAGQMTEARHAGYYAAILKEKRASLEGERQVEALAEVMAELDNVRVAWQWAITQNKLELIQDSLESIWCLYELKNWFYEGEEMFGRAVEALSQTHPDFDSVRPACAGVAPARLMAQLLIRQGWFCMRLARFEQTYHHLEKGVRLARQVQDHLEIGRGLHHLGVVEGILGRYAAAKQALEESLTIYRQNNGSYFDLGSALGSLGDILLKMGRFDQAKPIIGEGQSYYLKSGNPRAIALMYSFLGGFSIQTGNYGEAKPLLEAGLAFQKMIDDRVMIRMSLAWLGEVYERLAEYQEAKQQYEESLLTSRSNGDQIGTVIALNGLGRVNLASAEYQQAKSYLKDALTIAMGIPLMPVVIDSLISIAALLAQLDNKQRGLDILIRVLDHPAADPQVRVRAERLLASLAGTPPAGILTQARTTELLEAVVAELLAGSASLW